MEKSKTNKGLVVMVVVLSIALLGAIGYICYDKFMVKVEDTKQEDKLSEEEVMKLHKSLVTKDYSNGLYYSKKVSIDDIKPGELLEYIIANYILDNIDIDDMSNEVNKKHYVEQEEINNYTKKLFNTQEVIDFNSIKVAIDNYPLDSVPLYIGQGGIVSEYEIDTKKVFVIYAPTGVSPSEYFQKMLRYEQNKDEVYIYDKIIICSGSEGGFSCNKSERNNFIDKEYDPSSILFYISNGNVYDQNDKKIVTNKEYHSFEYDEHGKTDFNAIYEDFSDKLNTYKHTFKKASDGKYYWYSSEIVNE